MAKLAFLIAAPCEESTVLGEQGSMAIAGRDLSNFGCKRYHSWLGLVTALVAKLGVMIAAPAH
jgi:hypothetical protein